MRHNGALFNAAVWLATALSGAGVLADPAPIVEYDPTFSIGLTTP